MAERQCRRCNKSFLHLNPGRPPRLCGSCRIVEASEKASEPVEPPYFRALRDLLRAE